MSESGFRKGEWVEVTSDDEGYRGAWFMAKILRLPLGSNDDAAASKNKKTLQRRKDEFLVKYKNLTEEGKGTKSLKEYVHTSCVRPLPPKEPRRLFELNEFVDAFDLDAWWKGVVTKVFEKELKYVVYFQTTEERLEFLQSDVRVHLEWIDGQWSKPPRRRQQQQQQKQEIKQDDAEGSKKKKKKNVKKRGRLLPTEKSPSEQGKATDKRSSIRSSKKRRGNDATKDEVNDKRSGLEAFGPQASYDADMLMTEVLRDTADDPQSPPVTDNQEGASRKNPSVVSTRVLSNIADEYQSPLLINNKGKLASKSNSAATEEDPPVRTEISRDTADEHQSSPLMNDKEISPDKLSQSNEVATKEDTLLKDLEIPESFNVTKSLEEDTCIGIYSICNEAIKEQNEMGPASVDNQCKDSNKVEKEVTLASVYNRCDDASAKQNQMKESFVNHETRKECNEVHLEAPVIGSTNDKVSVENESLPFVKTSFIMWEQIILANEIFNKMPQSPHFRPLKQFNMAQREGMAIGHMVTFANVAAKTGASHIDDPRSNLEEISNALDDLEAHGFNVQAIQSRVQRLLEMKDKQLMSKEAEVKSIELKNKKDKFKTHLDKVEENLRFHEEAIVRCKNELEVLLKEMDKIESDISVCPMKLDESVKLEYPSVAAGSW